MASGVYTIYNNLNGKIYIGKANDIKRRWREHKSFFNRGKHGNSHMQRAWNMYGADAFEFRMVAECEDIAAAEKSYVDYFRAVGYELYNMAEPNGVTDTMSAVTKQKLSNSWTPERRKAQSDRLKGVARPAHVVEALRAAHTGRKASDETKAKLMAAHTGKKLQPHVAEALQKSRIGRVVSEETRAKIANSLLGHSNFRRDCAVDRRAKYITAFGETKRLFEFLEERSITPNQYHSRKKRGKSDEEALTLPTSNGRFTSKSSAACIDQR